MRQTTLSCDDVNTHVSTRGYALSKNVYHVSKF